MRAADVTPLSEIPPYAVFGAGALVGGTLVALARMRRRQRQARRFGRRIPLPASAPVVAAEQRLRAAASYPDDTGEFDHVYPGTGPDPEPLWYDDEEPGPDDPYPPRPDPAPGFDSAAPFENAAPFDGAAPETALRAAFSRLGSGLVAAGQPIPDVTGVVVRPSGLELLLDSPSSDPPPAPFAVPGGRQGKAWKLELPARARAGPVIAARAGRGPAARPADRGPRRRRRVRADRPGVPRASPRWMARPTWPTWCWPPPRPS